MDELLESLPVPDLVGVLLISAMRSRGSVCACRLIAGGGGVDEAGSN